MDAAHTTFRLRQDGLQGRLQELLLPSSSVPCGGWPVSFLPSQQAHIEEASLLLPMCPKWATPYRVERSGDVCHRSGPHGYIPCIIFGVGQNRVMACHHVVGHVHPCKRRSADEWRLRLLWCTRGLRRSSIKALRTDKHYPPKELYTPNMNIPAEEVNRKLRRTRTCSTIIPSTNLTILCQLSGKPNTRG